jgi:hypothetical protein
VLGADSELPKVRTVAARTVIGRSLLMIAVMASQESSSAVKGEGNAAVGAMDEVATVATEEGGGIAPSVQQQQDLLSAAEAVTNPVLQESGKNEALPRYLRLLAQIYHRDLGEHALPDTHWKREQPIRADLRTVKTFERRGSRAQENRTGPHVTPEQRHIPAMVSGRILLFIRGVVLFIHDDYPEAGQRGEDGRSGSDHDVRFPSSDAKPLVESLPRRQGTVQQSDPVTEAAPESFRSPWGEGDLWDQD